MTAPNYPYHGSPQFETDATGEAERRRLQIIRGGAAAHETVAYLASIVEQRVIQLDSEAKVLQAEGKLTGEAAIALVSQRLAYLTLFDELQSQIDASRREIANGRPPGT